MNEIRLYVSWYRRTFFMLLPRESEGSDIFAATEEEEEGKEETKISVALRGKSLETKTIVFVCCLIA